MRNVLLYTDEDGNWIADVPSLPGCHSDGRTREEAIERVKEAIEVYVEALVEDGLPVPEETAHYELSCGRSGSLIPKLPRISSRECIRALEQVGFYVVRQKGSHVVMRRDDPFAQTVVPENKAMPIGTLRSICAMRI